MFCDYCINDWLDRKRKCPTCREEVCIIRENDLGTAPLYVRQMINELDVICQICNKQMSLEAYQSHQKECKADMSSTSSESALAKMEINKLKNKINCLEGQLNSKSNEVKMVMQQRNELNKEVEKLKQENLELKEHQNNGPENRDPNDKYLNLDRLKTPTNDGGMDDGPSFSSSSRSATRTNNTTNSETKEKIKYVQDPSLLQQLADMESVLTSTKSRFERQIQNLKEDFEFQSNRDKRKIENLQQELADKEEEINNPPPWQIRNNNVMEISGYTDLSSLHENGNNSSQTNTGNQNQLQVASNNHANTSNLATANLTPANQQQQQLMELMETQPLTPAMMFGGASMPKSQPIRNEFTQHSVPLEADIQMYNPMMDGMTDHEMPNCNELNKLRLALVELGLTLD